MMHSLLLCLCLGAFPTEIGDPTLTFRVDWGRLPEHFTLVQHFLGHVRVGPARSQALHLVLVAKATEPWLEFRAEFQDDRGTIGPLLILFTDRHGNAAQAPDHVERGRRYDLCLMSTPPVAQRMLGWPPPRGLTLKILPRSSRTKEIAMTGRVAR